MISAPELADLLFPGGVTPVAEWEARYPPRALPPGARVTRFAPSPTGHLHTGGLYTALIAEDLARSSGGTYFVRIEDTDSAREVREAREQFAAAFKYFGIASDEGGDMPWGPYAQSERAAIYAGYAHALVAAGRAYPCFCTPAELEELAARQRAQRVTPGYYGAWAVSRHLSRDEAAARIAAGEPFVIRFRAPDGEPERVSHPDLIRGAIEQADNRNDAVILKSSAQTPRLPTYHFAHVVDDHLMRVTLVTRGEEWLPSLPLHHQLFEALGFAPPDYAHIAPLMKLEGSSKRKLSKRKDPEASVDFYMAAGYPAAAVRIYLRGLANGNLADIDFATALSTPLQLDRMGVAGPVFDPVKLDSISRNYIAELAPPARAAAARAWAEAFDSEAAAALAADPDALLRAFELERELEANPRKDVAKWSDVLPSYRAMLPGGVAPVTDAGDEAFAPTAAEVVRAVLADFADGYRHLDDRTEWFAQVRAVAARHGFAATAGEYKRAPDAFVGPISEASNIIRVALTGARRSPDLFMIARLIGEAEVLARLRAPLMEARA